MHPISLPSRLNRFHRDESGAVSVELLLVIPLLVFVLMGSVVFFEGFRARANNVKATYTVADILSREANQPITPQFMNNLYTVFGGLIPKDQPETLRVSVIRYSKTLDTYRVCWSEVRGTGIRVTEASLVPVRSRLIPNMYHGEVGIIVEAVSRYTPAFSVYGLGPVSIRNTMILRPRFTGNLCWSNRNTPSWTSQNQVCCPAV